MEMPRRLLPLSAMARRLKVPVGWLRDEADGGRVPHLRAGRAILFDAETVERVLIERAAGPKAESTPPPAVEVADAS